MIKIKIKCDPFVADYLKKKFGEEVLISNPKLEIKMLHIMMREKLDRAFAKKQIEKFKASFTIIFPDSFVFPDGKLQFRAEAIQSFNFLIRNIIARGMNEWMDSVKASVDFKESDMQISYLKKLGIDEENINNSTWSKIRLRYKQAQYGGPLRKKKERSNVQKNEVMSFSNASTRN